uniref:Uncharacterized protein n=1 Tax=Aegilops tauschii subsp. strangulata TaxID=200361 RepID=A0A453QR86_AEGTS
LRSLLLFSPSPERQETKNLLFSAAVERTRPMEQFHHGHHVRLRSSELGTYLHADEDGHGVSLHHRRASMKAAWAVHVYQPPEAFVPYLLLHSAAYGRYLAATDEPAPQGHHGRRVEQRNYDHPEVDAQGMIWLAVLTASGDKVFLRNFNGGCLRANGRYRPWNNGASVDDVDVNDIGNLSTMMHWVVEDIPAREIMPLLPRPAWLTLPAVISPSRVIVYVWLDADGTVLSEGSFSFSGRSVFRLRSELARWLADNGIAIVDAPDLVMCLPTRDGRIFPLVVDLPRSLQPLHIIVVIVGTPAYCNCFEQRVDKIQPTRCCGMRMSMHRREIPESGHLEVSFMSTSSEVLPPWTPRH